MDMDEFDAHAEQIMWFGDEPDPWEPDGDPYAGEFDETEVEDDWRGPVDDYFEQDMHDEIYGMDDHLDDWG